MMSENMRSALNYQINAELWSAYLYLAMSLDAESKALKGIANWFFVQWLEEQDHARIFQEFMTDRGAKVELRQIDSVQTTWKDPLEMFKDTLMHEKEVTEMINNLVRLALKEQDFATLSRLQWFVDEQVEEEQSADEQVTAFTGAANDFEVIRQLDKELGKRRYRRAEPLKKTE